MVRMGKKDWSDSPVMPQAGFAHLLTANFREAFLKLQFWKNLSGLTF
jgi:hypothetical protein